MIALRQRLEAIEGDITTLRLDAIVNAANAALMPGGGVDGAIRRKAGHAIDEDLYKIGRCEEGQAVVTPGYRLPARHVIHTVAPIWAGAPARAAQSATLARCYENTLALADAKAVRTIAFPAIGTGAYGWPAEEAAQIAFDAVVAHLARCDVQTLVTFCCFNNADKKRYAALIAGLKN